MLEYPNQAPTFLFKSSRHRCENRIMLLGDSQAKRIWRQGNLVLENGLCCKKSECVT